MELTNQAALMGLLEPSFIFQGILTQFAPVLFQVPSGSQFWPVEASAPFSSGTSGVATAERRWVEPSGTYRRRFPSSSEAEWYTQGRTFLSIVSFAHSKHSTTILKLVLTEINLEKRKQIKFNRNPFYSSSPKVN